MTGRVFARQARTAYVSSGKTAYVASWQGSTVTPIQVGQGARAIAITPDSQTAYVSVWGNRARWCRSRPRPTRPDNRSRSATGHMRSRSHPEPAIFICPACGMARRAPGGPPKAEPRAERRGPAAPHSGGALIDEPGSVRRPICGRGSRLRRSGCLRASCSSLPTSDIAVQLTIWGHRMLADSCYLPGGGQLLDGS